MSDVQTAETPVETSVETPVEQSENVTLADNPGDDTPASSEPSSWREDWREALAGGDEEFLKTINRYSSPENFAKGFKNQQKKISSGDLRRVMPDTDDEDALKAWRAEVGLPESPEGYLDGIEVEIGDGERPMVEEYLAKMHAAGADKKAVADGLNWYFEAQEKALEQQIEADKQARAEAEDILRSEWGPEYRGNINDIKKLIETYAPEGTLERFYGARLPDGRMFGDDPDVLKFLAEVARQMNPFGTVTPQPGKTESQTVKDRIAEIGALMADQHSAYWKGPQAESLQAELRRLYDIESRMG